MYEHRKSNVNIQIHGSRNCGYALNKHLNKQSKYSGCAYDFFAHTYSSVLHRHTPF